jgi:hypothetical protein
VFTELKQSPSPGFGQESTSSFFVRLAVVMMASFFFLSACSIFRGRDLYSWAELDQATDLDCNEWPGIEEDISVINDVVFQKHSDHASHVTAVGSGRDRKGRTAIAISQSLESRSLDEVTVLSFKDKAYSIIQGSCRLQMADQSFGESAQASYAVAAGDPPAIQMRRVTDNHLLATSELLPAGTRIEMAIPAHSGGCHVTARDEEGNLKVFLIDARGKVAPVLIDNPNRLPPNAPFGSGRTVKSSRSKDGSLILVTSAADGLSGSQRLSWLRVDGGEVKDSGSFVLKTSFAVDGSDVLPVEGGAYLAAIAGDSLVGEAVFHLSFYRLDRSVSAPVWTHVIKLPDIHLAPPRLFQSGPDTAGVLLPKWVDRESTVGSYKLSLKGFSQSGIHGVFPEPIMFLDVAETARGALFMVKLRHEKGWRQKFCEFVW